MAERRAAVLAADETGDTEVVKRRLFDLQRYVSQHMNTTTEQFYLEAMYQRDSQKLIDEAKDVNNPNGNIYKRAAEICDPRFSVYTQAYLQCMLGEIEKFPADEGAESVELPSPELYRHSFIAPLWSPDFAGFSLLACLVIMAMIIVRLVSLLVLQSLLKQRYKSV